MNFLQIVKSLVARMIFFGHGLVSVYLLYTNTNNITYWVFTLPLGLLLIEISYTIGYRKGREYKYVWPSGFLYIITIIPIIWITELDLLDLKIAEKNNVNISTSSISDEKTQQEIQRSNAYLNAFTLSHELVRKKVCELGIVIGLILGRWLMPRGDLTRDQLSALLLGYVGNAADIIGNIFSISIYSLFSI